jgi:hypothetical protein
MSPRCHFDVVEINVVPSPSNWGKMPMKFKQIVAAVAVFLAIQAGDAAAVGKLVPSANRVDMVHDAARGVIYVTEGDKVLRYHVASESFLSPITLGGALKGLDLSPDGKTLAVADRNYSSTEVWVHLIDLDTLGVTRQPAPIAFMEAGTWSVSFAADGSLLMTSLFAGSGNVPMRRFDFGSGTWLQVASVNQGTMLSASGDAQTIAFAESNSSDGPWGLYDVPTRGFVRRSGYTNGTSWFNFEIATDALGSQFAIPTYGGTFIYDDAYTRVATIGTYAGPQPIGVAYHPVENLVYFPWAETGEVRVYDTTTLTQSASFDFEDRFDHTGNGAYNQGRAKLSRDGSLLMVSVTGGVRFHRMYAPLAATDIVTASNDGAPVTVALNGSIGNGGQLAYSVVEQPAHGSASVSGTNATYVPEPGFEGVDTFTYLVHYGRATAEAVVAVTTTRPNRMPVAVNDAYTFRSKNPVTLPVLGNDSDPDGDALSIVAVTNPGRGTAVIQGDAIVYTPPKNFSGSTQFSYTISDGEGGSASAQVTVTKVH